MNFTTAIAKCSSFHFQSSLDLRLSHNLIYFTLSAFGFVYLNDYTRIKTFESSNMSVLIQVVKRKFYIHCAYCIYCTHLVYAHIGEPTNIINFYINLIYFLKNLVTNYEIHEQTLNTNYLRNSHYNLVDEQYFQCPQIIHCIVYQIFSLKNVQAKDFNEFIFYRFSNSNKIPVCNVGKLVVR